LGQDPDQRRCTRLGDLARHQQDQPRGDDISGFLATLDDPSNPGRKGIATLTRSSGNAQATLNITGITDHTSYVEVAIASPSGAAGFLNNNLISFQFAPAGDEDVSGAGTGNVIGPDSSTDGRIGVYDGATGTLLKDGGSAIADLVLKANNGSDFASKQATFDNLSLDGADIASGGTVNLETATGRFVAGPRRRWRALGKVRPATQWRRLPTPPAPQAQPSRRRSRL
jgi:hypothetical protein